MDLGWKHFIGDDVSVELGKKIKAFGRSGFSGIKI
jgi:hypothetical protein|tara:strand:- start:342 stop:446 length:105 start_codon:yes stop_codon:yes gene_type:complete